MQNRLLLLASYFFYGAWDYRFCALLATTTMVDYLAGHLISTRRDQKKTFLAISISINLTILFTFKYFNFFTESCVHFLTMLGMQINPLTLELLLPMGISFYTFQSMSYVIDVYRGQTKATPNLLDYGLYVSFFPQLVAGPIERSRNLLPQILSKRKISFDGIKLGCYFILYGLFLKIFVADNLARLVDPIFAHPDSCTGFHILLAGYGFAFQIYGDFAGYSLIAKGLGALLGFSIMDNFNLPYFSQNPKEFWSRWHISLSSWLRDYLYIPLGGSRTSQLITGRNLMITMLLGGLWHGAKMTFILWGTFHGILLALFHLSHTFFLRYTWYETTQTKNRFIRWFKILTFFHVIVFSWYLFRAESLQHLAAILNRLFFHFSPAGSLEIATKMAFYILPLLFYQLIQFFSQDRLIILSSPAVIRGLSYATVFYLILIFGVNDAQEFIYFQF